MIRTLRLPTYPLVRRIQRAADPGFTLIELLVVLTIIGLIVGLPLILIASVIVRLDSPGAALFRHKRPARSVRMRGPDLVGRPDLIPPPGGYRPGAQYTRNHLAFL